MTVIHQRLVPIQRTLSLVPATKDTPAMADRVSVSYNYINHVSFCLQVINISRTFTSRNHITAIPLS